MTDKFVKMEGICKSFGRVQALRGVDCTVYQNEVLGLLGDNGAGKSTLIKILVGIYPPDKGGIYLNGEKIRFSSNREARASGIETVYQDLALIGLMSISRNFFLGREPTRGIGPLKLLDRRGMAHVCKECLADIGIEIRSPDECVSCLSGGERQSIAIGRAVHFGAKLLILDEPTAALSVKESAKVLEYVREAKRRGLSVIFISHNIHHVYSVADRFTILDRGSNVGDFTREEVTPDELIDTISTGKKA